MTRADLLKTLVLLCLILALLFPAVPRGVGDSGRHVFAREASLFLREHCLIFGAGVAGVLFVVLKKP